MKVFYSDHYTIPLPEGHRFPMEKYRLVRAELLARGILREDELESAELPTREQMLAAHTARYFDSICDGTVEPAIIKRIGFPWSQALVRRSLASVGGSTGSSAHCA